MAFTEKRLAQFYPNATTNTTVYTVPALTKAIVRNIAMCNVTANPITVRVFAVPNEGNAGVANAIFYDYEVPENFTFTKDLHLVLDTTGDFLVVWVSAQGVTFTISGVQLS
jgi:hypothetical protein